MLCIEVVGRLFLSEESEGKVLMHHCCDISHCGSVCCALLRCCHLWHLPSQGLQQSLVIPATESYISIVQELLSGRRFATRIRNHKPREMEDLFVRVALLKMYNLERGVGFTAREIGTQTAL